jgi:hypothetical protein
MRARKNPPAHPRPPPRGPAGVSVFDVPPSLFGLPALRLLDMLRLGGLLVSSNSSASGSNSTALSVFQHRNEVVVKLVELPSIGTSALHPVVDADC